MNLNRCRVTVFCYLKNIKLHWHSMDVILVVDIRGEGAIVAIVVLLSVITSIKGVCPFDCFCNCFGVPEFKFHPCIWLESMDEFIKKFFLIDLAYSKLHSKSSKVCMILRD